MLWAARECSSVKAARASVNRVWGTPSDSAISACRDCPHRPCSYWHRAHCPPSTRPCARYVAQDIGCQWRTMLQSSLKLRTDKAHTPAGPDPIGISGRAPPRNRVCPRPRLAQPSSLSAALCAGLTDLDQDQGIILVRVGPFRSEISAGIRPAYPVRCA
jgi:hypothetical protein